MSGTFRKGSCADDLDLSLTGSHIGSLTPGRKTSSGRTLRRPNSLTDVRDKTKSTVTDTGKSTPRKSTPKGTSPRSARSNNSSVLPSPKVRSKSGSKPKTTASEDFLALFENSVQPKIKHHGDSRAWKSSADPTRGVWQDSTFPRKFKGAPPVSARSVSTVTTENGSRGGEATPTPKISPNQTPRNVFGPLSARSSSDESEAVPSRSRVSANNTWASLIAENGPSTDNKPEVVMDDQGNSSERSQQITGITNNMTNQGRSPRNKQKTALSNLENSYQNIRHKAPVNETKQTGSNSVGRNIAEDYIQLVNMAATKIQVWYKRHITRKRAGQAAMKRLLSQKRESIERDREAEKAEEQRKAEERKRIREEKAKAARQQAIQELKVKREGRKEEVKKKAEEQLALLQASGKLPKSPTSARTKGERTPRLQTPVSPAEGKAEGDMTNNLNMFLETEPKRVDTDKTTDDPPPTPSHAHTKTTLDDLLATLKKLEEDEKFATPRPDKKNSWLNGLEKSKDTSLGPETYLSAEKLEKFTSSKQAMSNSGFLSDDKLKSILNFLDEVQTADRLSDIDHVTDVGKAVELMEKPPLLVPSADEISQMEQASAAANEVTNTVLSQKLELEEKKRTVQMLQKALNQQRELTVRHARETEKEMNKRLDVQKDEYEEAIKRHLSFIDQLIDDKKALSEKCEQLVKELKTIDKKFQDKFKASEERHAQELTRIKEIHAAAEKLRREKWVDEKTKKIKEMTVKGLEPEIQRLIAKHKGEIKKIKHVHEAELLESDERAAQRYVKMTEELRDQLAHEKEAACSRERDLAKQRFEKQLQQEEEAYQQQRRRLHSEVQDEKERLAQQAARQRSELDKLQRQLEDSHRQALEAMKSEFEKAREEQERRHKTEVKELQERLKVEKESWEENYMKRQETWLVQKERELKEQVRRDRDKEIEMVIARLEEDNSSSRAECERTAENRIKRIRDKYEAEMAELERSERMALEKFNEMKARLTEVEGENQRLNVICKQKDQEIADVKKFSEKLHRERDHVSDVIRQEFADRIVATEEENKRLKVEMSELKARHKVELERGKADIEVIHRQKEEEMEEVHKRVKQAIAKKEDVVTQLKQQYQAAVKRADHLEGLLQQQRKQLLSK
ncbi:centrosomal protein of 131 kDa-like isoform X2 [Liolophura sinensis]